VIQRNREAIEKAHCTLTLNLEEGIEGEWDELKLRKAIQNLVENAIKFGPNRSIEVSTSMKSGTARIVISDHGIGIAPELRDTLFERFQKNVPTQYYGGLGLGLYITKCIVEAHQGAIYTEGKPGEGTTFTIELPLKMERIPGESFPESA
jgi:signal transduction histidine kinase